MSLPKEENLACDLSVFSSGVRRAHLTLYSKVILQEAIEVEELPDGYKIFYPFSLQLHLELSLWTKNEARCCPFLSFALDSSADPGIISLSVFGSTFAKAFIDPWIGEIQKNINKKEV